MNATLEQQAHASSSALGNIKRESVLKLVRGLIDSYPSPEDWGPPGPWGPIIRKAFLRAHGVSALEVFSGRSHAFRGGLELVALNPQPLPPGRFAVALAEVVIEHFTEMYEMAGVMPGEIREGAQRGVSDHLRFFIDGCGNEGVKIPKGIHWPPRKDEPTRRLEFVEVAAIGLVLETYARNIEAGPLQNNLAQGGARLIGVGIAGL